MTIWISFISNHIKLIETLLVTELLMLFDGASIDNCEDILWGKLFKYFSSCFLALKEDLSSVICADYDDTEIRCVEVDVNVE